MTPQSRGSACRRGAPVMVRAVARPDPSRGGHDLRKDFQSFRTMEERLRVRWNARKNQDRVSGIVQRTLVELDEIARDDVREIQRTFESLRHHDCMHAEEAAAAQTAPPARKDDTGAKPLEEPAEPEFFRDPQRANLALRADVDASTDRPSNL